MTVTINNKNYNQDTTHEIFKQGRKEIISHGITDEHGYINKALTYTELFTHILGNIPAIAALIEKQ